MTGSSSSAQGTSTLDRFFHITERDSTVATEVRAGLVTFFAMAYIIILNPLIIGTTGHQHTCCCDLSVGGGVDLAGSHGAGGH